MGRHCDDSYHSLVNEHLSHMGLTMTLTFQSPLLMVLMEKCGNKRSIYMGNNHHQEIFFNHQHDMQHDTVVSFSPTELLKIGQD